MGISLDVINHQPVEQQELRDDGNLDVIDIWFTIQGEGPFAGRPAIFLRLAGCNLSKICKFCDTDYTTGRKLHTKHQILYRILDLRAPSNLVVITGGEPFRQNLNPLIYLLTEYGYEIQIETNGTLYLPGFPYDYTNVHLVCSPKTGSINEKLKPHIKSLKYVVEAGKVDEDGLPLDSLGAGVRVARPWESFNGEVYVQPLDEQKELRNNLHALAAADSCLKHGHRLSLQMHKIVDLK